MKMLNRFPQSYSVIRIPTWVAIWIITSLGALRISRHKWDLHHFGLTIVEGKIARVIKRILRKNSSTGKLPWAVKTIWMPFMTHEPPFIFSLSRISVAVFILPAIHLVLLLVCVWV